ncbi:hypothetical protein GUITHDRAFT_137388 [Guillardia theta CCMP2712]|uniref:Ribosomal RNA large subunit methyltransferase K/L-like methyltransferase domain-containing protein n=1 Tax=Guillardia theta (strain CCMP2712) TaxID=905079 RepID=L1JHJ4_GUITC|nr:hypothetical protein GUITHDRAFT_137388 [Guillardia theta CCMP2712]EKX47619.1 hypothetical protein GUITHDRAFT_137388 [Guillardia theta CCMP2712]|eukprot:XP_005834599.1 hypothetical protein GUITHDRAFT_137388 [Guillardia theta CCMP2712]
MSRLRMFAGVGRGLEGLLLEELRVISPSVKWSRMKGGCEGFAPMEDLWRVCLRTRLAELLRVRIGEFYGPSFPVLIEGLRKLPWAAYLHRQSPCPSIKTVCHRSKLYHTEAVNERVRHVLKERQVALSDDAFNEMPDQDFDPNATVHLLIDDNIVTVSVDASGPQLHKRGYRRAGTLVLLADVDDDGRLDVGRAPLRETLAAACISAVNKDIEEMDQSKDHFLKRRRLWDPLCGSGTLVIEAVSSYLGKSAVVKRKFAFEDWPIHNQGEFEKFVKAQEEQDRASLITVETLAVGSDISKDAIQMAKRNAERSLTQEYCSFKQGTVVDTANNIEEGAVLLTNLPYGVRLHGFYDAWRSIIRVLTRREDILPYVISSSRQDIPLPQGWRTEEILSFSNRGIPVQLNRIVRGNASKEKQEEQTE